jgi:hypothetical protein
MYFEMIQQFGRTLKALDAILDKAERYAETKKFDSANFCAMRLAPDMLPFPKQIQIATDVAKGAAATLAGKEAPKYEDNEKTIPELRERIRKTHAYLETFRPDDFKHLTPKTVLKIAFPQGKAMHAPDLLVSRSVPNFFFHVTTTYALLRHAGVDIGKGDFLGQLNLLDA